MFGIKKKEKFDEKIKSAKYERILQTLKEILKLEIKTSDADGKEIVDYQTMCTVIKTKARLAVDFVSDLGKGTEED